MHVSPMHNKTFTMTNTPAPNSNRFSLFLFSRRSLARPSYFSNGVHSEWKTPPRTANLYVCWVCVMCAVAVYGNKCRYGRRFCFVDYRSIFAVVLIRYVRLRLWFSLGLQLVVAVRSRRNFTYGLSIFHLICVPMM